MEANVKWYQADELPRNEWMKLKDEGGYRNMHEISAYKNPDQTKHTKIGDKVAVLMNNGMVGFYTITAMRDASGFHIVGRDETGIQEKGMEFALDSSMGDIFDVGYKVLEKFPWE